MNACLNELLELTPHVPPETQRRIEKTEIIEMAIKHMRHLITTLENQCKEILQLSLISFDFSLANNQDSNVDSYQTGYRNALADIFDVVREYSDTEEFLTDFIQHVKDKDLLLDNLTGLYRLRKKRNTFSLLCLVMPDKKRVKYSTISTRSPSLSSSSSSVRKKSAKDNDQLCVISHVEECQPNDIQSTHLDRQTSTHSSDSTVKVPIFVLHPSGTHYIPMCIDSSVVSHAFKKPSNFSRSSSTTEQVQCHPVSIPVNFNPISTCSDSFELDIQNINVIGTRHQTSVRPN